MNCNEEKKVDHLLRVAHANRQAVNLPSTWCDSVMAEISQDTASHPASDFERLAPGFALAATSLSVAALTIAGLSLNELPGELKIGRASCRERVCLYG